VRNDDLLQELEDLLMQAEYTVTRLDKVSFTENHVQQLVVLRQFLYGLVWESSVVIRANSKHFY
jgi:hypothetical protein